MTYTVKEIYFTLQGEGINTGRPAVFCRFAGCNLWSGLEEDRATAICNFCDTDFVGTNGQGGGKFTTADELVDAVSACWPENQDPQSSPFVVCTGGEPILQLDENLIAAFHQRGFYVAVETNGTLPVPAGIDWICVSPKAGTDLQQVSGNELKFVYPQKSIEPEQFEHMEFDHFLLQPMDNENRPLNTQQALAYCQAHPNWRLSLQTHKILGLP
ncbi:MAG: 7-carboxy-7-deazaguanine synthase [Rhodospirillales bacterium]|jgi:7-carboxy-7-deazaguanine synthase (Cx14CxxC type)